jgi:folate-binding protein YgfZ
VIHSSSDAGLHPAIAVATLRGVARRFVLLDRILGQGRAIVRLEGPDTARFVQGTLTADVAGAPPGHAVPAALCNVKGKILTELVVLPGGEEACDLLVPAAEADALAEILDKHIIMDQVQVERPAAPAVAIVWSEDDREIESSGAEGVRSYAARHPGPGRLLVGELAAVLAAVGDAVEVDADGWAARRIATATPAWGHEIAADVFPPEAGFVYAVSYAKGCFLGQEPLARLHSRGQVHRVMARVRSDVRIAEGTTLASDERPEAGLVTTVAAAGEGSIALAIVRRESATEGATLRTPDGVLVHVTSGPLGDDPGVGGKKGGATVKLGGRR